MTAKHIQEAWDKLRQERDGLAAQVEAMRAALDGAAEYTALLDDFTQEAIREALALPNTAADILRQRDAQTKAEMLRMLADGQDAFDEGTGLLPFQMRKMAEELEENNG